MFNQNVFREMNSVSYLLQFSHCETMSLRDLEMKLQQLHAECSQLCFVAKELQKLAANITGKCMVYKGLTKRNNTQCVMLHSHSTASALW